jgi:hypothetical protein
LVPEELSMNVVPIPSSRKQRAFYNAEQKEVNIGLDYFNVVKKKQRVNNMQCRGSIRNIP